MNGGDFQWKIREVCCCVQWMKRVSFYMATTASVKARFNCSED